MHREKEVRYDSKTGEQIVTEDGRPVEHIVERPTIIKKRAGIGTWLGGLVVGVLLAAGGMAILANQQGSYQSAGAVVDQKVASAEQTARSTAEEAGDAAKTAGDKIEKATD
jgi:IS30 family transposase